MIAHSPLVAPAPVSVARRRFFAILGAILLLAVGIHFGMSADSGWPCIVMHNWDDYGFLALKGQLVANPGGLQPGEAWDVYPGHRPAFLYLPYLLKGGALADPAREWLYQAFMCALMVGGMQALFGFGIRGAIAALFLSLCPGYIANLHHIDTISYPALLGLSIMGFAGCVLAKETVSRTQLAGVFLLLTAFLLTNWSAAFSLGILVPYLLVKNPQILRRLGVFLVPLGGLALVVLYLSLSSRGHKGSTFEPIWNAYLYGPKGYDGSGMNWSKALLRISAVNFLAWLPLGGLTAFLAIRNGVTRRRLLLSLLPFITSFCTVLLMRNYHGHHPWGAVSLMGLGLLLSIELLINPETAAEKKPLMGIWLAVAILLFSGSYCAVWMVLDRNNNKETNALMEMINRTERNSTIVTSATWLPKEFQGRNHPLLMDRKVVSLEEWKRNCLEIQAKGSRGYLITHLPEPDRGEPFDRSFLPSTMVDIYGEKILDFYRKNISRRSAVDRIVYYPEYCLYKL